MGSNAGMEEGLFVTLKSVEFEHFDSAPKWLRDLLNYGKFKYSCTQIHEIYRSYQTLGFSLEETEREVRELISDADKFYQEGKG